MVVTSASQPTSIIEGSVVLVLCEAMVEIDGGCCLAAWFRLVRNGSDAIIQGQIVFDQHSDTLGCLLFLSWFRSAKSHYDKSTRRVRFWQSVNM